jgi:ABC-2 type transport system ATP-binding protein
MQQRLAFAIALIGEPDLLILDEPAAGLDPNGAREMLDTIREENERGATIFFSSHILEHVESICDRVAILNEGEIVAINSVEGLRGALGATGEISFLLDEVTDSAVDALRTLDGVRDAEVSGNTVTVTCPNQSKVDAMTALTREDVRILNVTTSDMSLEELFAAYTDSDMASSLDAAADGASDETVATPGGGSDA